MFLGGFFEFVEGEDVCVLVIGVVIKCEIFMMVYLLDGFVGCWFVYFYNVV